VRTTADFPKPTDRLPLGDTGLRVSPYCLGLVLEDPSTVSAAYEAGFNFFFVTGDLHWPRYELLRRGLRDLLSRPSVRDSVVIACASYLTQHDFADGPLAELLEEVPRMGAVDLYVMGGTYLRDLLPRLSTANALRDYKRFGIRSLGATFHEREAAVYAQRHALVDFACVRYNAEHTRARTEVFPMLRPDSPTLLYNFLNIPRVWNPKLFEKPALEGYWRPETTDFYRFNLTNTPFDGLLMALANPKQLEQFQAALEQGPLEAEEVTYLVDLCELATGQASMFVG
jgi:hypothetical protein